MNELPLDSDEPRAGVASRLYNLVYCSRASDGVSDEDIASILATARRRNPAQAITGVLVCGGGLFFQWLEGPRENVRRLMTLLHADPRHRDLVELSEMEEVRERLFPTWDMELATPESIREVLVDAHGNAETTAQAAALESLLQQFDAGELGQG